MKTRILLAVLAFIATLAACSTNTPTDALSPDRAALDDTPLDTTTAGRGGSLGPGH